MVQRDIVADFGRFADHHAGNMVGKQTATNGGVRVDVDIGQHAAEKGQQARRKAPPGLPEPVRQPVGDQGVHAG